MGRVVGGPDLLHEAGAEANPVDTAERERAGGARTAGDPVHEEEVAVSGVLGDLEPEVGDPLQQAGDPLLVLRDPAGRLGVARAVADDIRRHDPAGEVGMRVVPECGPVLDGEPEMGLSCRHTGSVPRRRPANIGQLVDVAARRWMIPVCLLRLSCSPASSDPPRCGRSLRTPRPPRSPGITSWSTPSYVTTP